MNITQKRVVHYLNIHRVVRRPDQMVNIIFSIEKPGVWQCLRVACRVLIPPSISSIQMTPALNDPQHAKDPLFVPTPLAVFIWVWDAPKDGYATGSLSGLTFELAYVDLFCCEDVVPIEPEPTGVPPLRPPFPPPLPPPLPPQPGVQLPPPTTPPIPIVPVPPTPVPVLPGAIWVPPTDTVPVSPPLPLPVLPAVVEDLPPLHGVPTPFVSVQEPVVVPQPPIPPFGGVPIPVTPIVTEPGASPQMPTFEIQPVDQTPINRAGQPQGPVIPLTPKWFPITSRVPIRIPQTPERGSL